VNNCKMSVLVLQYNASVIEVQKTIQSILRQQNIEFEIVVADDGSKENHFTQLEDYFKARGFSHYTLVNNPHNGGTVKNILSGVKMCNGKYVKCISPGDYLYDEGNSEQAIEEYVIIILSCQYK